MTRLVVNAAKEPVGSYLYVGRPMRPRGIDGSPWGNPFTHRPNARGLISVESASSAVRSYERWLLGEYHEEGFESWRSNALREMWRIADALSQGIPLGCWCGEWNSGLDEPPICHATVLVRLARGWFSPHGWVLTSRTIPTFGGDVHAGRPAQIESIWRDSIGLVCNVTMRDGRTISALPLNALAPLVGGTRSIASSPEAGTAA